MVKQQHRMYSTIRAMPTSMKPEMAPARNAVLKEPFQLKDHTPAPHTTTTGFNLNA
jgi:hypothetical protein